MRAAKSPPFLMLYAILLFGVTPFFFQGCASSAARTEQITIPTINGVMAGWAEWVKAGHATQTEVDAVKKAYIQYYNAQLTASNAFRVYMGSVSNNATKSNLDSATSAVDASKFTLLKLITTFKP